MKLIRSAAPAPVPDDSRPRYFWKLLVVDDEPDIRAVTRLNLKGFRFANRELEILEAGSAAEARALLEQHRDLAVALIDVVMEAEDSGLKLVEHIREALGNHLIRIVIRTGQPGAAPERYVIDHYDIDDYKDKTELTAQRLYTTVRSALKSYRDLRTIDINRQGLQRVLDATPDLYRVSNSSLNAFFQGVLMQIIGLCRLDQSSFISTVEGMIATFDGQDITIQAQSGAFESEPRFEEVRQICIDSLLRGAPADKLRKHSLVLPLYVEQKVVGMIFIEPTDQLAQADLDLIRMVAFQCSSALENLRLHIDLQASFDHAIDMLAEIAEFKDKTTGSHINRIDAYTRRVALEMGVPPAEAVLYGKSSRLHDVGKVGIPDHILSKPARLDAEEFAVMQRHTEIGSTILRRDRFLDMAREVALHHHERWDGRGYPSGRPSREFSLATRIVSVVDVFDALVSKRPYKEAWSLEQAVAEIEAGSGGMFDPEVVEAFLKLLWQGEFDPMLNGEPQEEP
jgi:response regulator RpfG family c-di-GMP phosphodiesterase